MTLPEPVEVIRTPLLVQPARGARVTRVTVVLSDGRVIVFHEVAGAGACEGRAEAFALARAVKTLTIPPSPPADDSLDLAPPGGEPRPSGSGGVTPAVTPDPLPRR